MTMLKAFFHRIIKDFKHKELWPLKLLFFVHASTLYVLYPYLTIHMRELGINVEETAIMSAVTPIVAIVMPPLAGMVADRIGNFKILLSIFSSLGGGAALLLLLVPVGRITFTYPEKLVMDLSCHENSYLQLSLPDTLPCSHLNSFDEANTSIPTDITLESCGFACDQSRTSIDFQNESNRILQAHNYNVIVSSFNNDTESYFYTLKREEGYQGSFDITEDARNHKQVQNNEYYTSSIRKLSNYTFYFPTLDMYNLSCGGQSNECHFGSNNSLQGEFKDSPIMKKTFKASLKLNSENNVMIDDTVFKISLDQNNQYDQSKISKKKFSESTCQDMFLNEKKAITVSVQLHNLNNALEVDNVIQLSSCQPHCIATLIRKNICTDMKKVVEYDVNLTFWAYLLVRVFFGMIGGTAFAMFEGAVIAILREQNGDYGMQRIYATMGGMISSPLSGLLIDYASRGNGYTDIRPAFYLYAGLKILSGVLMLTINLEFKVRATNVIHDVLSVIKNVEMVTLFVAIFILGTAWGYIESFLFWLLQDLGASGSLMGITITVAGIAGIPLLVLSGPIIDRIGHANVLFIGFIFYAIRLLGYSIIYNPWLCLVFEAMESVTSSLSFTAAVTYAAKLSSTTTDTSIQGLLGGIYFGVGKGVGSLIGGYLMKGFGTRSTFRIFSVMCTITGIGYFLFNRFYLSRRPQSEGNEIVKKKVVPSKQDDGGQMEIALTQKGEKSPEDIEKKDKSNRSNVESGIFNINSTINSYMEKDGEHLNHSANKNNNEAYVKDELEDEIKTQTHENNVESNRPCSYENSFKALSEGGKLNESLVMDDEYKNETEEEKNNVYDKQSS